jgi:hypothetical protein
MVELSSIERATLSRTLKRPRFTIDLVAGSLVLLGLLGCFQPGKGLKTLSLAALLGGIGTLSANAIAADRYAQAGLTLLEQERQRRRSATDAAMQRERDWQRTVQHWTAQVDQRDQHLCEVVEELSAEQQIAAQAIAEVSRLESDLDHLRHRVQRQDQQQLDMIRTAQGTLTEALSQWRERLLDSLEQKAARTPELSQRMDQLKETVEEIAGRYHDQIAALPAVPSPLALLDEALSLLHHYCTEYAALKVQFRNALNIAEARRYQERIESLTDQIHRLQDHYADTIPRAQHDAILEEFQLQTDEAVDGLRTTAAHLEQELNTDTEEYVQKLLSHLDRVTSENARLTATIKDLSKPHTFRPATRDDLRMANLIIDYFYSLGIVLDRSGSEYHKHEAKIYFHSDRNPRLILPAELNEHAEKVQQILHCFNLPRFTYDAESGLMSVRLELSRQHLTADCLKSVGTSDNFFRYISTHPIRYRVIGDPGVGKTPLAAVMVSHLLNVGARKGNVPNGKKMPCIQVGVSYPNAETSQKDEVYPLAPFLFARNDAECRKAINTIYTDYQRRRSPAQKWVVDDIFQLWIIDEADNTIASAPNDASGKLRDVLNDGGHYNIGWILLGQSVNTTKLKGWTNDDRKKSVEIVIGATKIRAWVKAYADEYYGEEKIAAITKNLDSIQTYLEKGNDEICDSAKQMRLALVADPISPKLFLLPDFDQIDFDLDAYEERLRQVAGRRAGMGSNSVQTMAMSDTGNPFLSSDSTIPGIPVESPYRAICPDCGTESTERKGRPIDNKQRYFCTNKNCDRKTFTVDLNHEKHPVT